MERKICEEGGTIIAARRNLSLWKNDGNRVKERKERSWNVSAMRVDGRHATMHPGRGWSRGGRRRRCGVCVGCVCQYHVQCYHSEACMAGVGNDVTQYLGVSLVWNTTLHRLYFRRTTPCIKSFLQSGTQWASLPFGLTILPVNWPGSFVSNSNRVGIFF